MSEEPNVTTEAKNKKNRYHAELGEELSVTSSQKMSGESFPEVEFSDIPKEMDLTFTITVTNAPPTPPPDVIDYILDGDSLFLCTQLDNILRYAHSSDFSSQGISEAGYKLAVISVFNQAIQQRNPTENIMMLSEVELRAGNSGKGYADLLILGDEFSIVIELKYIRLQYVDILPVGMRKNDFTPRGRLQGKFRAITALTEEQLLKIKYNAAGDDPLGSVSKEIRRSREQGSCYARSIRFNGILDTRVPSPRNKLGTSPIIVSIVGIGQRSIVRIITPTLAH